MAGLFVLGSVVTLWHWKDPRSLTAVLWMGGILFVGTTSIGWRSARLVGALPVMSLMPALAVAHGRASILRWAPATLRRVLAGLGCLLLLVALYEAWWVEFVWRVQFRNVTYGLCRTMHRVALPATIYVAGTGSPFTPEQAVDICAFLPDSRRHFVTLPSEVDTLPRSEDPNVIAFIFPDRPNLLRRIRESYPAAIEEPYIVNGPDPFGGLMPGAPATGWGNLAFNVVWVRSSCPAAPLLQTYDWCAREPSWP